MTIFITNKNQKSSCHYLFLDNELVKMRIHLPYSAMPGSIGKPMHSAYYFKGEILVDRYEINFPEVDIEKYKNEGLELFKKASAYLKNKLDS